MATGVSLGDLAALAGAVVVGDRDLWVTAIAPLAAAGPRDISFLTRAEYRGDFENTQAGAVIVGTDGPDQAPMPLLVAEDPYLAMAKIAQALAPRPAQVPGTHASAFVDAAAEIHPGAVVEAGAVVAAGARVGPRTAIGSLAYVGEGATVGADCVLHPGARVLARSVLGDRVILHAGAVIGSDGFGYAVDKEGRRHKIPQLGVVVLEDDVEIGANSTVDRATFGETRLGRGTKIDNLVQVAHNVAMGRDCVVAGQAGIAGSARLGQRVILGGQSAVAGHVTLADDVIIAGRGGVTKSLRSGVYAGMPARPHAQWQRQTAIASRLSDLLKRIRRLERGET